MKKIKKRKIKKIATISLLFFLLLVLSAWALKNINSNKAKDIFIAPAHASSFTDSVTALGATEATIHLTSGSYSVDSDFTIPQNITLHFDQGAAIVISNGATLAIYGNVDDCIFKIFDDQNSDLAKGVKFKEGSFTNLRAEWWGAKADNSPASSDANSNAIEKAMYAYDLTPAEDPFQNFYTGKMSPSILFLVGKYYIGRSLVMRHGVTFLGQGDSHDSQNGTVIILKDNANCNLLDHNPSMNNGYTVIKNIQFDGGVQSAVINGLNIGGGWLIRDCLIKNINGWAMYFTAVGESWIENNRIENCANGIFAYSWDMWMRNNTINFTGDYGIEAIGLGDPVEGNIIDGGSSGKKCMYYAGQGGEEAVGNTFRNCDDGIYILAGGGPILLNNTITNNRANGINFDANSNSFMVISNTITGNGGYGIRLNGGAASSQIKDNNLTGNSAGAFYFNPGNGTCSWDPQSCREYAFVENNTGVDSQNDTQQTLSSGAEPVVAYSKYWKTNNASAVTIRDFTKAPRGKEIYINFGDSNTTLKFTANPSANLVRNGDFSSASDWTFGQQWSFNGTDHAASRTAGSSGAPLEQDIGAVKDDFYEVTLTIKNYASGMVTPIVANNWTYSGMNWPVSISGNGTYTRIVKAESASTLKIYPTVDFVGEVDDISVRRVDSTLKGYNGQDKTFASGDQVRCLKGDDTYWYCDNTTEQVITEGDLNVDGKVDTTDLDILKTDFLKLTADLANPRSDINGDGQATVKDVGIMMSQWAP